jgi:hypothetical protein
LSHAVARLEERGWVERLDCATDRRVQVAQLTPAGFAALEAAAPAHVEQVRRVLFDQLEPEQAVQLRAISEAILAVGTPAECRAECDAEAEPGCEAETACEATTDFGPVSEASVGTETIRVS